MFKKLMINCANCDARTVSEETLKAYESIHINCAQMLVTPETKDLMSRYGVSMNCANVMTIPNNVRVNSINGSAEIKNTDVIHERTFLMVNGSMEIGEGTEKVLENYVAITVNGSLLYPESMSGYVGKIQVNGSTTCYPDGAVLLKRSAVIDKLFALRAKNKLYWSSRRMVMVDPQLDGAVLAAKGARFSAKEVILTEAKVESLLDLIDEKAEIIIVPDGTAVVMDDVELSELTVKKYGRKLYIIGDMTVSREAAGVLEGLEYLNIRGDASVPSDLKQLLLEKADQIGGEVKASKGRVLSDKMTIRVSRKLLEQEQDGILVTDCMTAVLDEDIPSELIYERLTISDCMKVKCTPEQETAVGAVSRDVMTIGDNQEESGIGSMVKGALGIGKELLTTKIINAADYVL